MIMFVSTSILFAVPIAIGTKLSIFIVKNLSRDYLLSQLQKIVLALSFFTFLFFIPLFVGSFFPVFEVNGFFTMILVNVENPLFSIFYYLVGLILVITKIKSNSFVIDNTGQLSAPEIKPQVKELNTFYLFLLIMGALVYTLFSFRLHLLDFFARSDFNSKFGKPELCQNILYEKNGEEVNNLKVKCIEKSLPSGKKITDYCDLLIDSPYRGDDLFTKEKCYLKKQTEANDPASCKGLSIDGDYESCISHYEGSQLHEEYCTSLESALSSSSYDRVFRPLLDAKCISDENANSKSNDGFTPIFYANSIEQVNLLIAHHADLNIKNDMHQTPLIHHLREGSRLDIIKLLINSGADIAIVGKGYAGLGDDVKPCDFATGVAKQSYPGVPGLVDYLNTICK